MTRSELTVVVTRDDITAGERESERECPIALAASRVVQRGVFVGALLWIPGEGEYGLPPEALDFIALFDDGCPVEPFTFVAVRRGA